MRTRRRVSTLSRWVRLGTARKFTNHDVRLERTHLGETEVITGRVITAARLLGGGGSDVIVIEVSTMKTFQGSDATYIREGELVAVPLAQVKSIETTA